MPEDLAEQYKIKLTKLLRLPTPEEMGSPPSGQPRMHQYPQIILVLWLKYNLNKYIIFEASCLPSPLMDRSLSC